MSIIHFSIALSTWPSSKANYQVSSSSPGSNWIQLILVSHEWGILKETFFDTRKSWNSNPLSDVTELQVNITLNSPSEGLNLLHPNLNPHCSYQNIHFYLLWNNCEMILYCFSFHWTTIVMVCFHPIQVAFLHEYMKELSNSGSDLFLASMLVVFYR